MRVSAGALAVLCAITAGRVAGFAGIVCDADSDCFYVPKDVVDSVPALVVLHCNGAKPADLDSFRVVGDSLGWIVASCGRSRNHRDVFDNDRHIVRTVAKLRARYPVDPDRVFVFGFSGQGVQALAAMFLHPQLFRGVVAVCAHRGALSLADWDLLGDRYAYLVTREQDWNRTENEIMFRLFNSRGVFAELRLTPGEHGPGPRTELLAGCRWLGRSVLPD